MANPSPDSTFSGQSQNGQLLPVVSIDSTMTPVNVTSTTAQSAAFGVNTNIIRVVSTTACHINFGANPTSTTSNAFLPANAIEYYRVTPGEKISFIRNAADGVAYISEIL